MKTRKITWAIKYEDMGGTRREAKIKAATYSEAIDALCRMTRVGNIFAASDCYRVRWL